MQLAVDAAMHHPSFIRCLAVLAVATSFAACTDLAPGSDESTSVELAAQSQALHTVKVSNRAILITDFAVPLACKGLEGSVFIPDLSGNTHGTTITSSDCAWSSQAQLCECTITYTQRF